MAWVGSSCDYQRAFADGGRIAFANKSPNIALELVRLYGKTPACAGWGDCRHITAARREKSTAGTPIPR